MKALLTIAVGAAAAVMVAGAMLACSDGTTPQCVGADDGGQCGYSPGPAVEGGSSDAAAEASAESGAD